jgi:hypothetical protein
MGNENPLKPGQIVRRLASAASDFLQLGGGQFAFDISGVEGRSGLEQENLNLLLGERAVLDAALDDNEFARFKPFAAVGEIHAETPFDHEKHFVFVVVMMPDEFALKLHQFDLLAIQLTGDFGLPVGAK